MNYIKKIMKEITKHFKFNGNKITIYQMLWNVGSWVHRIYSLRCFTLEKKTKN